MFDYNLLGKGYRYSDFRNVRWDMSDEAKEAFTDEYNRLYVEKHGCNRTEAEEVEQRIDDVAGDLFQLVLAFTEKLNSPNWAKSAKIEAQIGSLLSGVKQLLL